MIMVSPEYDMRVLVEMLCDRRSRAEKDKILFALTCLRKDDQTDAEEMNHLRGEPSACAERSA